MKLRQIKIFKKKLGNKGLTIVGTLVASAIGLIVVAGTTHLLIQLTSRISQQESRAKRPLFYSWIAGNLENPTACLSTMGAYTLSGGNEFDVSEIKDAVGTSLIDFYTPAGQKTLEDEFGIDNFDKLQFKDYNATTGEAQLVLYTKSFLHGTIPIYNKDFTLNLIGVTVSGGTPNQVTGCSAAASGLSAVLENIKLEDSSKLTLVGGGTTTDITAAETTAYGYNAGSSSTGAKNTFLGFEVGEATTGGSNTFVGYQSGKANDTGGWNVFAGQKAGTANTTGRSNVFIGNRVGEGNTTGRDNVFIGQRGGFSNNSGNNSVFVGSKAGEDNTADGNTFIGKSAGEANTTGADNIFIGHGAAPPSSGSDIFVVGSGSNTNWINGTIGSDTFEITGDQVCLKGVSAGSTGDCSTPSSRVYKKNIKAFKDFEKSLQDILSTPLFTYQYKENHPEKSRMGVISEELPANLQIKLKGAPSHPDWPSIYGTLWAGIKALTQRLADLKTEVLKKMAEERRLISQDFTRFKKDISLSLHVFEVFSLVLKDLKTQWVTVINQFKEFKNQLSHFKSQFKGVEGRLKEAEGLKTEIDLLNRTLAVDGKAFKEGQKQIQEIRNKILGNEKQLLAVQKEWTASEESLKEVQTKLNETEKQILENQVLRDKQFEDYNKKLKVLEGKVNK